MVEEKEETIFGLQLETETSDILRDAAKWGRTLGVLFFIWLSLSIIGIILAIYQVSERQSGPAVMVFFFYLLFLALLFIPAVYLFRFGKRTITAIDTTDQLSLNHGLTSLKSSLKFMGIYLMVLFGLMAFALVIVIIDAVGKS